MRNVLPAPSFKKIAFTLIRKNQVYAIQLLAGVIGIVFVLNFTWETGLYGYLFAFGEPATGRITHVDRMQISNRWRTYVDVTYADSAGTIHSGRRFVLSSAFTTGETLTVRYVKQAPALFILEDELTSLRYVRNSMIMLVIGLALAVPCVPRMIVFFRLTRTIRRLLRNGRRISGEILEIKDRPYKLGHYTPRYLIYQFNDSRGRRRTGESVTIPGDREAALLTAKILPVLVDPADPDIHFADVLGFSG